MYGVHEKVGGAMLVRKSRGSEGGINRELYIIRLKKKEYFCRTES